MTTRRRLLAILGSIAILALTGQVQAQQKLRLGVLPFSESLGAIVAHQQGFFKAEGLDVEMSNVGSGAQGVPLLLSGRMDIVFSNTVTTLQALEQGLDATILAPGAVARSQGPDTGAILVLKGVTPKDLRGKRVAVNVINSTAWMYMSAFLDKRGIGRDQVRFVEVPFPQMNDALLNKQFDAIVQVEPFTSVVSQTGKVDVAGYLYIEAQPGADITQYIALASWVKSNPETAPKFVRAIVKGSQFANSNDAATRQINQKFTNLNPALKDTVLLPRLGTSVNPGQLQKTMELMLKYGLLKRPVDLGGRVLAQP